MRVKHGFFSVVYRLQMLTLSSLFVPLIRLVVPSIERMEVSNIDAEIREKRQEIEMIETEKDEKKFQDEIDQLVEPKKRMKEKIAQYEPETKVSSSKNPKLSEENLPDQN